MDEETKTIKKNALKFSWYMRGGVSYEDVLNMSESEREAISQIIDENLETTKKTQMPFF
jgi:ribosomal protein S28E/S33